MRLAAACLPVGRGRECGIYPIRNNAPLEFLTGLTLSIRSRINIDIKPDYALQGELSCLSPITPLLIMCPSCCTDQ